MEIELARTILNIPYDVYKSFNYVTNELDSSNSVWWIYYRKSKKSRYTIRVMNWKDEDIIIDIGVNSYPLRIEYAPKYLIKIVTKLASYLSILGFPTRVYGL